ncbi:transposon Ty3-I Gag-Pol polyprotein [Nephila pilipes]|uniref:Transposon Ty3-I Gag-Pol polyprotein n=1 Tax=Nephila pilipes TaxID=299642 RepID=A0A8X6N306_NEPPI|nr:transposon Ty3-I Gag-Pol polyprotein [Nephila pilipes]
MNISHIYIKFLSFMSRLKEAGLIINTEKCRFSLPGVIYLGHKINALGIEPTAERIKVMKEFPQPATVRDLRKFLGIINFYRRFIPYAAKH